jgi:putative endonuclease
VFVYMLTNRSKHPFYTGVARSLRKRVWDHKNGLYENAYTSRYRLDRLVYYEQFISPIAAISREKQSKGLTRLKKVQLVVSMNPEWKDLSDGWYDDVSGSFASEKQIHRSFVRMRSLRSRMLLRMTFLG